MKTTYLSLFLAVASATSLEAESQDTAQVDAAGAQTLGDVAKNALGDKNGHDKQLGDLLGRALGGNTHAGGNDNEKRDEATNLDIGSIVGNLVATNSDMVGNLVGSLLGGSTYAGGNDNEKRDESAGLDVGSLVGSLVAGNPDMIGNLVAGLLAGNPGAKEKRDESSDKDLPAGPAVGDDAKEKREGSTGELGANLGSLLQDLGKEMGTSGLEEGLPSAGRSKDANEHEKRNESVDMNILSGMLESQGIASMVEGILPGIFSSGQSNDGNDASDFSANVNRIAQALADGKFDPVIKFFVKFFGGKSRYDKREESLDLQAMMRQLLSNDNNAVVANVLNGVLGMVEPMALNKRDGASKDPVEMINILANLIKPVNDFIKHIGKTNQAKTKRDSETTMDLADMMDAMLTLTHAKDRHLHVIEGDEPLMG